jgi:hypothetical protein
LPGEPLKINAFTGQTPRENTASTTPAGARAGRYRLGSARSRRPCKQNLDQATAQSTRSDDKFSRQMAICDLAGIASASFPPHFACSGELTPNWRQCHGGMALPRFPVGTASLHGPKGGNGSARHPR